MQKVRGIVWLLGYVEKDESIWRERSRLQSAADMHAQRKTNAEMFGELSKPPNYARSSSCCRERWLFLGCLYALLLWDWCHLLKWDTKWQLHYSKCRSTGRIFHCFTSAFFVACGYFGDVRLQEVCFALACQHFFYLLGHRNALLTASDLSKLGSRELWPSTLDDNFFLFFDRRLVVRKHQSTIANRQ